MPIPSKFKEQVQLVAYLVHKFGSDGVEIVKAVKLIALADIYALRHHGTTLSGDVYYAMKNGPVASTIDDIIEQSDEHLGDEEHLRYVKKYLAREGGDTWSKVQVVQNVDDNYLSERDTEVIDRIFKEYGSRSAEDLVGITHDYSAWKKHEKTLEEGSEKRVLMDETDFFENDGELAAPDEAVALSREFYGTV